MIAFWPVSCDELKPALSRHYSDSKGAPPGRKLAWRILERGATVGWIGLGEPSYKLAPRRALGLEDARPLPGTVSCFVYRLEGPRATAASAILRLWEPVARAAWSVYEPVQHLETMCQDRGHGGAIGACFRRAGWRALGWTTGRTARRPAGSCHDAPRVWGDSAPKLVLYKGPLARVGRVA